MSVTLIPDAEQLLSQFLLAQAEVTALVGQRVYTAIPKAPTFPLVRLSRISGEPVTNRPLHLDRATIQIDAYGGSKKDAQSIIETVRAVIADRIEGTHDLGVVTGYRFGPLSWLPDPTDTSVGGTARARYVADVDLLIHP